MGHEIEKLLSEFCPSGVKYGFVADIASITRGQVMSKDFLRENAGEYPVYSSQTENEGMLGKISIYMFDGEYLTWTTDGANAGTVFYRNGKFSVTNVCGVIDVTDEEVSTKYLFYILNREAPNYVNKGMGNPKLMSNVMAKIKIPLPPLPVQQEIVRILDHFTALTAELTAELTAPREQYEYYRDELLKVQAEHWTTLGDKTLFHFHYGKGNNIPKNSGVFQVYGCNGIVGNTDTYNCEDVPIIGHIGSAGIVNWGEGKVYVTYNGTICDVVDRNIISTKFLYHFLQSANLPQYVKGSQPFLSVSDFEKVRFPLLTMETQNKIVSTLDRFDALCNDLSSGLPAEIAARQKQYEYYRDKLLTFKELGA